MSKLYIVDVREIRIYQVRVRADTKAKAVAKVDSGEDGVYVSMVSRTDSLRAHEDK